MPLPSFLLMIAAYVLLGAGAVLAARERNRREAEQGVEPPAPYAWPKRERMVVRALDLPVGRRLTWAATGCFVVAVGIVVAELV